MEAQFPITQQEKEATLKGNNRSHYAAHKERSLNPGCRWGLSSGVKGRTAGKLRDRPRAQEIGRRAAGPIIPWRPHTEP